MKINRTKIMRIFKKSIVIAGVSSVLLGTQITQVFATGTDNPLTVINNLSDFVFGLVRAVGMIILGFGVVQVGMSLKSHDPSQRANGFMTLARRSSYNFCKGDIKLNCGQLKNDKDESKERICL